MVVTHCGMRPLDGASGSQRPSEQFEAASSWRSGHPNMPLLIATIVIIAITGIETAILCEKCDLMSAIMVIAATAIISGALLSIAW